MKVIKHGQKPEDKELFFICYHCKCEYVAKQNECEYEDEGYGCNSGYVLKCPDCECSNFGTGKDKYLTRKREDAHTGMKNFADEITKKGV